jgi:hypothetical protein
MIAEQAGETDPDAIELRVMAEDERRELLADIEELEVTVTVSAVRNNDLVMARALYKRCICVNVMSA